MSHDNQYKDAVELCTGYKITGLGRPIVGQLYYDKYTRTIKIATTADPDRDCLLAEKVGTE